MKLKSCFEVWFNVAEGSDVDDEKVVDAKHRELIKKLEELGAEEVNFVDHDVEDA